MRVTHFARRRRAAHRIIAWLIQRLLHCDFVVSLMDSLQHFQMIEHGFDVALYFDGAHRNCIVILLYVLQATFGRRNWSAAEAVTAAADDECGWFSDGW